MWGVGAHLLFGGPRASVTERMARSGSGSLGIASLHFLTSRLGSLSLFLQKRKGWRRRIKLQEGHQAKPMSAFWFFARSCSSLGGASAILLSQVCLQRDQGWGTRVMGRRHSSSEDQAQRDWR